MGNQYFDLVMDLEKHGENLSEWEIDFVDSISNKLGEGKSLSEKQIEMLKQLHEKRVG